MIQKQWTVVLVFVKYFRVVDEGSLVTMILFITILFVLGRVWSNRTICTLVGNLTQQLNSTLVFVP